MNCRNQGSLFKSSLSCILHVTSGVPHGSHLAATFLLYLLMTFPQLKLILVY